MKDYEKIYQKIKLKKLNGMDIEKDLKDLDDYILSRLNEMSIESECDYSDPLEREEKLVDEMLPKERLSPIPLAKIRQYFDLFHSMMIRVKYTFDRDFETTINLLKIVVVICDRVENIVFEEMNDVVNKVSPADDDRSNDQLCLLAHEEKDTREKVRILLHAYNMADLNFNSLLDEKDYPHRRIAFDNLATPTQILKMEILDAK